MEGSLKTMMQVLQAPSLTMQEDNRCFFWQRAAVTLTSNQWQKRGLCNVEELFFDTDKLPSCLSVAILLQCFQ